LDRAIELAFFDFKFEQFNQTLQAGLGRKQFQQPLLIFN
jgi:hypothetical protein